MAATDLTYLNLQDACLKFGYGEVDRANFKDWLNMAQSDIFTRRRWNWASATENVVTVANTQTVALSSLTELPLYWGRLKPTLNTVAEPRFIDDMGYNDDWPRHALTTSDVGMPQAYSIFAQTITFYPIPDAIYTYSLRYWHGAIDMSADIDKSIIPREFRRLLIWGALCYAAERDRDTASLSRRTAQYERYMKQMMAADAFNQSETQKKAKMPDHYYGAYDGAGGLWRP